MCQPHPAAFTAGSHLEKEVDDRIATINSTQDKIRPTFPNLPVIGISTYTMSSDESKAIATGCTEYLTKPVDEDNLLDNLKLYLNNETQ